MTFIINPETHIVVGIRAIIVEIRIPNSRIRRVVPIVGNNKAHINTKQLVNLVMEPVYRDWETDRKSVV